MDTKHLLIVDDDQHIQRMLRFCLEANGYLVEQAADGAQALESIQRHSPDVVLLDLAMPVLDGMSVLADLRSRGTERMPHVIVMTASGSVRSAIQAVRLGAADFLEKPITPDDIRQSLASVLGEQSPDAARHGVALQLVREAWRRGKFIAAEAALARAAIINDNDPCLLNLAGVLHEAHGRLARARHFYERAAAADPQYEPAHYNVRRLCQIEQKGYTRLEVALGDEPVPAMTDADVDSSADRLRNLLLGSPMGEGR